MSKLFLWAITESTEEKDISTTRAHIKIAMARATFRFSHEAFLSERNLDDETEKNYPVVKPNNLHYAPNLTDVVNILRNEIQELFPSLNIDNEPDEQLTPSHIAFSL